MPYLSTDVRSQPTDGSVQAQFTRPSNATQYTAGDVVGPVTTPASMTFTVARAPGWGGKINGVTLHKSDDDLTTAAFDFYLFDADPVAIADNSAFAPTDAEGATIILGVSFLAADGVSLGASGSGTGNLWQKSVPPLSFACAPTLRALYGVLVARGAYTPASAEIFSVTLHLERN